MIHVCMPAHEKNSYNLNPGYQQFVTSTSQYQVFVEKFDQEPKKVRIKMADLAGP